MKSKHSHIDASHAVLSITLLNTSCNYCGGLLSVKENLVLRQGKLVGFVDFGDRRCDDEILASYICGEFSIF